MDFSAMAENLDKMDRDLPTWEASFLDSVLRRLRAGDDLSDKQAAKLREIYERYLGDEAKIDETADDVDF